MTWLVPKGHKQHPETAIRKLIFTQVRETNVIFGCNKDHKRNSNGSKDFKTGYENMDT